MMLVCIRVLNFRRSPFLLKGKKLAASYTSQKGPEFTSSFDLQPKKLKEGSDRTVAIETKNFSRLFVSNIPLDATWKDLKDHFAHSGGKYASLSSDPVTQKPRGCGLISFDSVELAHQASKVMDGTMLKGSILSVRLDRKTDSNNSPAAPTSSPAAGQTEQSVALAKAKYTADASGRSSKSLRRLIRDSMCASTVTAADASTPSPCAPAGTNATVSMAPNISLFAGSRAYHSSSMGRGAAEGSGATATATAGAVPSRKYSRLSTDPVTMPAALQKKVEALIQERATHRSAGNFARADELLKLLQGRYGVQCDDANYLWQVMHVPSLVPTGPAVDRDNRKVESGACLMPVTASNRAHVSHILSSLAVQELAEAQSITSTPAAATTTPAGNAPASKSKASSAAVAVLQQDGVAPVPSYSRHAEDVARMSPADLALVQELVQQRAVLLSRKEGAPVVELANVVNRLRRDFCVRCDDATLTWAVVYREDGKHVSPKKPRKRNQQEQQELLPSSREGGSTEHQAGWESTTSTRGVTVEPTSISAHTQDPEILLRAPAAAGKVYKRDAGDIVYIGRADVKTITELVQKRAALLREGTSAAEVEEQLQREFSVYCDDQAGTWAVAYDRSTQVDPSITRQGKQKQQIPDKQQGQQQGQGKDPWDRHGGVVTADMLSESVKSIDSVAPAHERARVAAQSYKRDAGDIVYLGRAEVKTITELVQQRAALLREGASATDVDEIEVQLQREFSVYCDDQAGTWAVAYDRSTQVDPSIKRQGKQKQQIPDKQQGQQQGQGKDPWDRHGGAVPADRGLLRECVKSIDSVAPAHERARVAAQSYKRDADDIVYLGRGEVKTITELVRYRSTLLKEGASAAELEEVDDVEEQLQREFSVYCDDQAGTWAVAYDRSTQVDPSIKRQGKQKQQISGKQQGQQQGQGKDPADKGLLRESVKSIDSVAPAHERARVAAESYKRDGGDIVYLGRADVKTITELVQKRAALLREGTSAAEVEEQLQREFSVYCDDQAGTWAVAYDRSTQVDPSIKRQGKQKQQQSQQRGQQGQSAGRQTGSQVAGAPFVPARDAGVTKENSQLRGLFSSSSLAPAGAVKVQAKSPDPEEAVLPTGPALLAAARARYGQFLRLDDTDGEGEDEPIEAVAAAAGSGGTKTARALPANAALLSAARPRYGSSFPLSPEGEGRAGGAFAAEAPGRAVADTSKRGTGKTAAASRAVASPLSPPLLPPTPQPSFMRALGDNTELSPETLAAVEALVEERARLLDSLNKQEAHKIAMRLRQEFDVGCIDMRREWYSLSMNKPSVRKAKKGSAATVVDSPADA